jgi:hypothetical protein
MRVKQRHGAVVQKSMRVTLLSSASAFTLLADIDHQPVRIKWVIECRMTEGLEQKKAQSNRLSMPAKEKSENERVTEIHKTYPFAAAALMAFAAYTHTPLNRQSRIESRAGMD